MKKMSLQEIIRVNKKGEADFEPVERSFPEQYHSSHDWPSGDIPKPFGTEADLLIRGRKLQQLYETRRQLALMIEKIEESFSNQEWEFVRYHPELSLGEYR